MRPRDLATTLSKNRAALLDAVTTIDDAALALPTRNAGWTVRDVLAHVLAADADLLLLLEPTANSRPVEVTEEHDRREMARWAGATANALVVQLRENERGWRTGLDVLNDTALARPVRVWWRPEAPLSDVLEDWREHDHQHAEDVRLALEPDGRTRDP